MRHIERRSNGERRDQPLQELMVMVAAASMMIASSAVAPAAVVVNKMKSA